MGEIIKVHCNLCRGTRRQEILYREITKSEDTIDDAFKVYWTDIYEMLRCCGCESVSFRHQSSFSEEVDEDGKPIVHTTYYPPTTYRHEPRWLSDLFLILPLDNDFIGDLIREIYVALRNGSPRLAVMGIRALLEQVMIHRVGDQGTFSQNLDEFERKGMISKSQRTVLEPLIEVGHAAMHRSYSPTNRDLTTLMDIIENVIESIYVNEVRAEQLKGNAPRRPGKK